MSQGAKKSRKFVLPGGKLEDLKEHAQRKVQASQIPDEVVTELNVDKLQPAPWNARRHFDAAALAALGSDLSRNGQIHPVLVRPLDDRFEIVVGERRYRAALQAGLPTLKAYVRHLDDAAAQRISLAENLGREDLNPFEETVGYLQLLTLELGGLTEFRDFQEDGEETESAVKRLLYSLYGKTQRHVNNVINVPPSVSLTATLESVFAGHQSMTWQSFVQNRLTLLDLPDELREALQRGDLEYTKATALARVNDAGVRSALLTRVLQEDLSIAALRIEIRQAKTSAEVTSKGQAPPERAAAVARLFKKRYATQPPKVRKRVDKLLEELERLLGDKAVS